MVLSQSEITARKDRILGVAIDQYIKTVTPVSSSFIAKKTPMGLSSATVRNVLAELETEGFLTHPHTSAGRVPTQKGYRYYVDHLMNEIQMLEDEKQRIKQEYEQQSLQLDLLLEKTSQVISDVTNYTSIISVDGWDKRLICCGRSFVVDYPDTQDIEKIQNILKALDEKEKLLSIINRSLASKVEVYIGHEIACSEIESCSLVVSEYKLSEGASGRIAVLGPTSMNYQKVVSALDYFSKLMREIN